MTHTSAPWVATPTYPDGEFVVYSKTAAGRVPSECRRVAYVYEKDDATLIAAAPDMLAALKLVAAFAADDEASGDANLWTDHYREVIEVVRAQIARFEPATPANTESSK